MIERLRKDLADNEMVIETLRKIIGDEDLIEAELMKVINKGPPRMWVATREELWMEIKKLKSKLGMKLTKEEKELGNDEEAKSEVNDILKENMSELEGGSVNATGEFDDKTKWLEEGMRNLQFELRDKNEVILNQKEEIENLKVEVRARDMNISRMNKTMQDLHD